MIEDKIQIDEEIKKLPFIEHYKKMWPFVKPYMFRAILAILICIPIGALDSVVALSLKPYMDIVLVDKTESSPAYIPLLIVAFTSVQGFLNYAATYLNTWVGTKINQDLKRALYKKLLHLETSYYDQHNSGFVIQRFNTDCDIACSGLLENLKVFVSRFFSSISLICVLIYNSWQLAIIAVLILGCALMPLASVSVRMLAALITRSPRMTTAPSCRGVRLEDVFQQAGGDPRVDADAVLDDVLQARFLLKDNQRPHMAAAQILQAADDFVDNARRFIFIGVAPLRFNARAATNLLQCLAQFRLKEDDQHQRAVVHHAHQQPVQCRQPEEVADADDEQQHGKPLQNSAAPRVAGEHQQFIDNNGNDENIRNIGKTGAVQHVPEKGLQRLQERCHASSASFSILNDFMRSASPLYNKLPRI